MPEPLLQLRHVRLGPRRRLHNVSLDVHPGVTALLGPSGCGKTSLINILVGFETPDAGRVVRQPDRTQGLPLYWSPQDLGLWPHLTARQHLHAVAPRGSDPDHWLEALELTAHADRLPGVMSWGQRSRLAVARALASQAALLVMDEPLAHLEPALEERCWRRMMEYLHDRDTSLLFATHLPQRVLGEADHVVCMQRGEVRYEGTTEDLYWRPPDEALALYLGPCNWLDDGAAQCWLGSAAKGPALRPEQVTIEPAPDATLSVVASRHRGPTSLTTLRHPDGAQHDFWHRSAVSALSVGQRVRLIVSMLLLVFLLVSGCSRDGDARPLAVKQTAYWSVPSVGPMTPAPRAIAVDDAGLAYVLDTAGRVLVYDRTGAVVRQWSMPTSEAGNPEGLCLLRDGRIAVADTHYYRVVMFDRAGELLGTFGEQGRGPGQFIYPVSVAQDDEGNLLVAEYGGNDRIQRFTPAGKWLSSFAGSGSGPGQFQRASGMCWSAGRLYVADAINNRVQVFDGQGQLLAMLEATGLHFPYDVWAGPDGSLYVAEYGSGRVTRMTPEGQVTGWYGQSGRGEGQLLTPWNLCVTADRRLLIADTGNRRVVELRW